MGILTGLKVKEYGAALVSWAISGVAIVAIAPAGAAGQVSSAGARLPSAPPAVYLECVADVRCDAAHFRDEITFVEWVDEQAGADVHVTLATQTTGAGENLITLDFVGLGAMTDLSSRLAYPAGGTDLQENTLDGLTQTLQLGLVRFAVESGLGREFDIRYLGQQETTASGTTATSSPSLPADPWNFWTFRVGLSGNLNLAETSTNLRVNPSFSADRVTEGWKLSLGGNLNVQRSRRELTGGREVRDDREEWSADGLIVRSVSGHLSWGVRFDGEKSVEDNQNVRFAAAPALEYNYFPYVEANRRQFTVQYSAGFQHSNYIEETIYNQTRETRPQHAIQIRYNAREQWGNAGVGATYSQYLHDTGLYRAGLNGNLSYRITRGLDLTFNGGASWNRDEIHIPISELSDEDILLGRISLPSSYQYNGSVGLSYRWGSSFTNVVNTRMGN